MDWSRGSGRVRRVQSNSNCDGSSSSLELMLELSSKARCCMAMAVGADEMAGKSVLFSGHLFRPVSSSFLLLCFSYFLQVTPVRCRISGFPIHLTVLLPRPR